MPHDPPDIATAGLERDALSEVLAELRPKGVSYGRCHLRGDWGIDFNAVEAARFHFLAEGSAWIRAEQDGGWIELQPGDAVLLSQGTRHVLAAQPHATARPLEQFALEPWGDRSAHLRFGEAGTPSLLYCGTVSFESHATHPLFGLMPAVLSVRQVGTATLRALLDAMAEELQAQRPGAASILTRLADTLLVTLIRAWAESQAAQTRGLGAALRDPRVGRALLAMHRQPGHRWSVESLAEQAVLSRSAFAQRFTAATGQPVAGYLARLRMTLAQDWLSRSRITVAEVAAQLGYESEASFSRAFRRLHGVPPRDARSARGTAIVSPRTVN